MGKVLSDIFKGNAFTGDKGIWMIYFFLCLFSLVEVYSASSNLTYTAGHHWDPMINQAIFLLVGLVVVYLTHLIPCKYFMLFPLVALPFSLVLLIYAAFFGGTVNGANRWIEICGMSVQPSELGKASLVMFVAVVLAKTQAEVKVRGNNGKMKVKTGAIKGGHSLAFKVIMLVSIPVCALIFFENFSTAALLFFTIFLMMWVGRVPIDLLTKTFLVGVAFVTVLFTMIMVLDEATLSKIPKMHRGITWKHRIEAMVGSGADSDSTYSIQDNLQEAHAQIAIANSNVIGRGPGNSVERDFLPHAESDFIYSIIVEETGIIGAIFVLFLYVALVIRAGRIAKKCQRFFPAYLVIGLATMITLQALLNMIVATGLFVTGQPLPLISRGGSSLLINCFYIGVILSVSRYVEMINSPEAMERKDVSTTNETNEYYSQENMD
ncbi:MAG: FtsW/RodA/SpoVE family cell cycle protein [Bacteroidaceae bacterium]|jgi:cell division protein FtsW|nr:FtsW/RodA/SpoVE family cell cycle protein [Bacteroidaceae bacterium]